MPAYQIRDDARPWRRADDADELAEALAQTLNPPVTPPNFIRIWPDRAALPAGQTVRPLPAPARSPEDAENSLADLIKIGWIKKAPDFDDAVKVILATFTVFTGLALTRFLTLPTTNSTAIDIADLRDWRWWAFFALVALLLRYIIGSAIHLKATYGGEPPHSHSVVLLFKDLMFLVFFGMLALYIMEAANPGDFVRRAMFFVAAGFAWSIIDYFMRRFWLLPKRRDQGDTLTAQIIDAVCVVLFVLLVLWSFNIVEMPHWPQWNGVDSFLQRAAVVIAAGIVFAFISDSYTRGRISGHEWPAPFWRWWTYLDGAQFLLTGLLLIDNGKKTLTLTMSIAVGPDPFNGG
jgi:hypothetical protein